MPHDNVWYSVVINNPTPEDEDALARATENGWLVEGQLEKGKNGTLHYQLAVRTDEGWTAVKQMFPRANISEAEDPVALRRYVVKTETRAVDLTTPTRPQCRTAKINNVQFFDALICTIWDMDTTFMSPSHQASAQRKGSTDLRLAALQSAIEADTSLTLYDRAVELWMVGASTPQFAMELATRAIRPDVRAIYRRYRSALAKLWTPESSSIDLPTNADDNEGRRQESREVDSSGSEDEDEGACEDEAVSEGEGGSDSGQGTDSSDQESDASE